jgi:hypothetical protein
MTGHYPTLAQKIAAELERLQRGDHAIRAYLSTLHPVDPGVATDVLAAQGHPMNWRMTTDTWLLNPVVIDLSSLTPEMKLFADSVGMSLTAFDAIFTDMVGFGTEGGVKPRANDVETAHVEAIRSATGGTYGTRAYLQPFFQAGGLVAVDPFTGRRCVSTHSFLFDNLHIAYRFSGIETFYVVIGGIQGLVRFCCIPRLDCIVLTLVASETEGHKSWSCGLYRHLMFNILEAGPGFAQVLHQPRRALGVAIGSHPNLGHFIWQELAGIEEILLTHGPGVIRHILVGPHAPLPVLEIFPELGDRPVTTYDNPTDVLAATFELPYQHMRPIHASISVGLRRRIFDYAERVLPPLRQDFIADAEQKFFIFWITLRSHNKAWVDQVDGNTDVIRRLAAEIPNFAVLLDGWTDTREVANAIKSKLPPEITVIDTIGCSLPETLIWARSIHIYAAPVSTGLHFPAHFGNRPGVAHANVQHLRQDGFWNNLAPSTINPTMLAPDDVRDMSNGDLYDSYEFPPDLLYRRLRELIVQYYPDRLRLSPVGGVTVKSDHEQ